MMQSRTFLRRGYSLTDFIAAAGCIALVSMLLVPAVLQARQQARGNLCKNRLKMMGLALHNYHDTYLMFPPGWVTGYRDGDSQAGYSWMSRILPFLDQANLYNQISFERPMPAPDKLLSMDLESFQCPDDTYDSPKNDFRGGYGRSSYSGNLGDLAPIRWSDGRVEAYWPGAAPTFASTRNAPAQSQQPTATTMLDFSANGLFFWNSSVGIRDIIDGTSNTISVSERSRISGGSIWPGVGSNRFENDAVTDVSFTSPLNKSLTGFSSPHEGGVHVGMVDGQVRFLSNSVESSAEGGILQHLGNRRDQAVIPPKTFSD